MGVAPGKYIDTVIESLYDSLGGPAGCERNWDQMLTLFLPGAHIMRADVSDGDDPQSIVLGIKEFIASIVGVLDQKGFFGQEIARRTEMSGNIANVFSTYEARFDFDDQEPFRRGTNKIQLYHDGQRWWIINMLLDIERNDEPPPKVSQTPIRKGDAKKAN